MRKARGIGCATPRLRIHVEMVAAYTAFDGYKRNRGNGYAYVDVTVNGADPLRKTT